MKTLQRSLCLLLAALLSACTAQSPETAFPPTATPTPTLPPPTATATPTRPPPTATPTRTPRPTFTPTAVVAFLCPPASAEGEWECREFTRGRVRTHTCAPAPLSEAEWLCYEDLDYGIALEFPASFRASIPMSWGNPSSNPEAHARYHKFVGETGNFELDIWLASEPDLAAWLEEMRSFYSTSGARLFPAMEPNAAVGGQPAFMFIQEGHHYNLTVFFGGGGQVYRLQWLWFSCEEEGLPTVRRILDSVRFSPEPVPAEIPDDVWQQALGICRSEGPAGP